MYRPPVALRSSFLLKAATIALMAGFAAGCSSDPFTTGATTGTTRGGYGSQPIPPRAIADTGGYGAAAATPSRAVTATALPPVGGAPDQYAAPAYPTLQDNPTYNGTAIATAPAAAPAALPSPAPAAVQQAPAVAAAAPTQSTAITAEPGDTLYSLSRRFGVSVAAIAAANGLTQTSTLLIGQRLVIPAPNSTAALGPAPLGTMGGTQPVAPTAVAAAPAA